MKAIHTLKLAVCVVLAATSFHTHAEAAGKKANDAGAPNPAAKQQLDQSRDQYRAARAANRKLAHAVRVALVRDGHVTLSNVIVRARDGDVALQGSVPETPEVDHATEVAKKVTGVRSVTNALSVRQFGG